MKLTIITSTLNCLNEIKKTASSIKNSGDITIQWIVVDGKSSDGTVEFIEENLDIVDVFISEPDSGIYDAWNKAVNYIDGEWVLFLGAGDELKCKGVKDIFDCINTDDVHRTIYFGNVNLVDSRGLLLLKYKNVRLDAWSAGRPDLPCHQGVLQHCSLFNKKPVFDTKFKIAADSKFLLSHIRKSRIKYIDTDVANMEYLGVSTDPKHVLKVKKELKMLREDMGIKAPIFHLVIFNIKSYVKHFISNFLGFNLNPRRKM